MYNPSAEDVEDSAEAAEFVDTAEHDLVPSHSDEQPVGEEELVLVVFCDVKEKPESGRGTLSCGIALTAWMMLFVICANVNSTSPSIRSRS